MLKEQKRGTEWPKAQFLHTSLFGFNLIKIPEAKSGFVFNRNGKFIGIMRDQDKDKI